MFDADAGFTVTSIECRALSTLFNDTIGLHVHLVVTQNCMVSKRNELHYPYTSYLFGPATDFMERHPSLSLLDMTVSYDLYLESQNFSKKAVSLKETAPVAYVVIW